MNTITIDCKNIVKFFSKGDESIEVLKNVDFVAHENEIVILMGPSGSGKTTLISIIAGLLKQDQGSCLVLGKSINELAEAEKTSFRGSNIGFMFQHINLIPTLDVLTNVAIPLLLRGVSEAEAFKKSQDLLVSFGLEKDLHQFPIFLSGGEQQRVSIARACVHDPKIILCDEPTSFLDLERGKKIMDLLQRIKQERNATIIIVTHDPRILSYADTIVVLEDGVVSKKKAIPS